MARMAHRACALVLAASMLSGCGAGPDRSATSPQPVPHGAAFRVLMVTATRGFRHDSIGVARDVMSGLSSATGEFTLTLSEDIASITGESLAGYDVLCFALTTGELPFSDGQKGAILSFVSGGKGFIGIHSATDTLYEWPDYGPPGRRLFQRTPVDAARDRACPRSGASVDDGAGRPVYHIDEFYTFRENPGDVQVLLRLDPASVGSSGDYPLAWAHLVRQRPRLLQRTGSFRLTWRDTGSSGRWSGALRWAAGR